MSYNCLELTQDAQALRITLNRPERLNALSPDLLVELRDALEGPANNAEVRAVLLTGAGRGFCAGADLGEAGLGGDIGEMVERLYNPVARAIVGLPKPVIAAVNGVAAGAGMSLALACDMRLLSKHASFSLGFMRIGLSLDASSSYFLPRLVGRARAFELAYSGRRVEAEEACRLGLGETLLPSDGFGEAAWTFAKDLAAGPTRAYRFVKELLNASSENSLEAQLALEARLQARAGATADAREGVQAFKEKRTPQFTGE